MSKELLTAKEAAEYLNINEKKVYALVKARRLPGTKVTGKWLFPKRLLDEWLVSCAREHLALRSRPQGKLRSIVFHGSNDVLIEVLAHMLRRCFPEFSLAVGNIGSLGGLGSLKNGLCQVAGVHLFDPESGEYNLPYVRRWLEGLEVVCVHLARRRQGLLVARGNPLGVYGVADLARPEVRFVNRQAGSGTRVLLDYELARAGVRAEQVRGYGHEVFTHFEVALEVFSGYADAGVGIYPVARSFRLDFVPLAEESYDLVIPKEVFFAPAIQALLKVVRSSEFKEKAKHLGGYDLSDAGELVG